MLNTVLHVISVLDQTANPVFYTPTTTDKQYICPEYYNDTLHRFVEDCPENYVNKKSKLFSVLIDARGAGRSADLPALIVNITTQYPGVKIRIAVDKGASLKTNSKRIEVVSFRRKQSSGYVWNSLVRGSPNTEFLFLARNLSSWNSYSDITRLLRMMISYPNIAVTGGSIRNTDGNWYPSCHQLTLQAYGLRLESGYDHSLEDCMHCDYTSSSILVRKSVIKNNLFDKKHNNSEVSWLDFLLTLREKGQETLVCPDVMFHQEFGSPLEVRKKDFLPFIRKWQVDTLLLPKQTITYTCPEMKFSCRSKLVTTSYLLPKCCINEMTAALSFLEQFLRTYNIPYKISSGLTLGAVKFNGFLPWDLDGDVWWLYSNFSTFLQHESDFNKKKLTLAEWEVPKEKRVKYNDYGYFSINTPSGLYVEMFGADVDEVNDTDSSKVAFDGVWLTTHYSPGKWARDRYGKNSLKHAQSWYLLGKKTSWEYYAGGHFTNCKEKFHHACLNHFPTDGNRGYYLT